MGLVAGIIWLVLVFVLASSAKKKGRSYGAFFALGFFFSPLIGFIILLIMGENKEKLAEESRSSGVTKKCPFCANDIKKEAIVCQYCGRDLPKIESVQKNKLVEVTFKDYPEIIQKANEAKEQYGKGTYVSYLKDMAKELGLGELNISENDIE
jgi:hypothetical protein